MFRDLDLEPVSVALGTSFRSPESPLAGAASLQIVLFPAGTPLG
jgi:hypothetical protein